MAEGLKIINPPPIEIQITDLDGKEHKLTAKLVVTVKNLTEVGKVFDDAEALPPPERHPYLMSKIYGGEAEFYKNFELRALKAAVNHFNQCNANPI